MIPWGLARPADAFGIAQSAFSGHIEKCQPGDYREQEENRVKFEMPLISM